MRGCEPSKSKPALLLTRRPRKTVGKRHRKVALEDGRKRIAECVQKYDLVVKLGLKNLLTEDRVVMKNTIATLPNGEGVVLKGSDDNREMAMCLCDAVLAEVVGGIRRCSNTSPLETDKAAEKIWPSNFRLRLNGTVDCRLKFRDIGSQLGLFRWAECPLSHSAKQCSIACTFAEYFGESICGVISELHRPRCSTAEKMYKVFGQSAVWARSELVGAGIAMFDPLRAEIQPVVNQLRSGWSIVGECAMSTERKSFPCNGLPGLVCPIVFLL
jgi:hypothetical protein